MFPPRLAPGSVAGADQPLTGRGLRLVMALLAFACGASVANLYYAQPLLGLIRQSFDVSGGTAALVVTVTQVGYAVGLALLLPLGDLLENRKLASRTLVRYRRGAGRRGRGARTSASSSSPRCWSG